MSEKKKSIFSRLLSPRAAAINGILFSLLFASIMIINHYLLPGGSVSISRDWVQSNAGTASLVLALAPFAGITFLWFTAVNRDWLGDQEDRFFSTVFFGSGVLFVGLFFVWAAAFGAIFRTYNLYADRFANIDFLYFGIEFKDEIIQNFARRVLGVYMLSICSHWSRTKAMPRWLIITTQITGLGFVFMTGSIRETRFIFPAWVFLVSVYILILNYRRTQTSDI